MKCRHCGQDMDREEWLSTRRSGIYKVIIDQLKETPSTVVKISEDLDVSFYAAASALDNLKKVGWVKKVGLAKKAFDAKGKRAHIFGVIQ